MVQLALSSSQKDLFGTLVFRITWLIVSLEASKKGSSVMAQEVKRYERERRKNKSTYWITHELLWRDFVRFGSIYAGGARPVSREVIQ